MDKSKAQKPASFLAFLAGNTDIALTFGFFGIIVLLVLPVPTGFLDLLLAMSIGISLLILLIIIYIREPSEFSVFPVVLLGVTLFRLGLNVASTRLILIDGYAGEVIQSFGYFVVRGNYLVGGVVFLILVIINFVVITKGASRIAEVAARFTLDSLPGKQMSIDAELNAGIIDEAVATSRRLKLQKEADFYGAMDGASKFVRGDAIAGILITLVNIVGGITIGMFEKGLPLMESLQKYTLLSIGDGLVSQIPALIVSVGAGVLITRTSEGVNLGQHLGQQLRIYPKAIGIAAVMLFIFGILPGMPFFPFFSLAVTCGIIARLLKKHKAAWSEIDGTSGPLALTGASAGGGDTSLEGVGEDSIQPGSQADLKKMILEDIFTIELGYGLLSLADKRQSGDLLERITGIRQKFAKEVGMIIPPIAVKDNLDLDTNEYRFLLRGKEVTRGAVVPSRWLAVNVANSDQKLNGIPTREPVFDLEAYWVVDDEKTEAEVHGYTVVDGPSVLITHLSEVVKEKAFLMLEREDVQKLIDVIKEKNPTLINELLPDLVTVGVIHRVLQNLVKEHISIKNMTMILETIGDFAAITKNPDDLSEQVRKRLGFYFVQDYENADGIIKAVTLDPSLENELVSRIKRTQFEIGLMMDPELTRAMLDQMNEKLMAMVESGCDQVIVTVMELRLAFKRFFEPSFPKLVVLAYEELPPTARVENVGFVSVQQKSTQEPLIDNELQPA